MTTPHTPPTTEERLEAIEYFLGQTLLALESDSAGIRAKLARLEQAINKAAPSALPPATDEDEDNPPFTMNSNAEWLQTCLMHMRKHQSVTARQMVAIGELTDRVMTLGESLTAEPAPPIEPDVQAALERLKRQPPTA